MFYSLFLEDRECGQHQHLEECDQSAGPSKEPPVDSTSPDTRHAEGGGVNQIEDDTLEPVVCPVSIFYIWLQNSRHVY